MPPTDPDALLARLELFGMRLGLDTIRDLLRALGDPQRHLHVVLVAGTNGKGSTASLLAAIAGAAGYRVGLYTSPHLERVEERIRIAGGTIGRAELAALLEEVIATAQDRLGALPTYFEALTAAAFLAFLRARVDLAVVETGLGGRLDATNASEPLLSLITEISLEHREQLGDTLAAIAREKAGILRSGRPALAWVSEPEARGALAAVAARLGTSLAFVRDEVEVRRSALPGEEGERLLLRTPRAAYDLRLPLPGRHQAGNLALAVRAAEVLAGLGPWRIDGPAVARGVARCRWPGRLETVDVGGRRVLLDAAHNPGGAAALLEYLGEQPGSFDLLFGVLADKEAEAMLPALAARARRVILSRPASGRARDPAELAGLVPAGRALLRPAIAEALDEALTGAPELLVVCGSIYLVGAVRILLRERFGVPPPATDEWPA